MSKNRKLVPKLIFPKFRNTAGWSEQFGNVLFDQISDKKPHPGLPVLAITQEHGAIPRNLIDYHVSVTEKSIESYKVVQPGDFIISLRSFQGGIEYSQYQGICSPAYVVLRRRGKGSDAYFRQYLKTEKFIQILTKNLEGLRDGKMISYKQFSQLQIPVPVFEEQQKIADCLSSLDELIAAQTRKVDALKTHKKWLMQQLFPREGKTQPRLRFPEFRDADAWSKRKLSDFLTERSQFPEIKVPLYSLTIEDGVTPKTERYERAFLVNNEAEAYKLVLPNDFAFNPMNLRFGAIGRHSGTEAVAVSKYYNIFYCDDSVDSRFCAIYFRIDEMVRFYDTMAIGSLIEKRRVHFSDFLKFNIRFPSLLEQHRIADCLTSLDILITAATQELETLKTHKKGLMQQLFPSAEAVEV